ncbi:MAG: acyl carrier protein [Gammaproteobacteria bacterium]|nr:acyl carrier protein [Gammaproteobacteria bacterium]
MVDDTGIRATVLAALVSIAPDAGAAGFDFDRNIRDQVDFDSVDFLNFVLAIGAALGIEVPERDYPKLGTLTGCVTYLRARLG